MLVLSRRKQEKIVLPDCGITITVLETRANRVRIGIDAPRELSILRAELPTSPVQKQLDVLHTINQTSTTFPSRVEHLP